MENSQKKEKSLKEYLTDTTTNVGDAERVASTAAGGALIAYGIKRKDWVGGLLALVGGGLALRGATGHCQLYDATNFSTNDKSLFKKGTEKAKSWFDQKVEVVKSVTINKPAAELYKFWRNFENLPQFMKHLEAVKVTGEKTSEWTAKGPVNTQVHWNAEVTEDVENKKIAWQSLEGADVPNSGTVEFKDTGDRGTVVKVTLKYSPPAGKLGELAAYFLTEEPDTQVEDDLRRFKSLMEAGSILSIEGQPSGRAANTKTKAAGA